MRTRTLITSLIILISLIVTAGVTQVAQAAPVQPAGPTQTFSQVVFEDEFTATTLDQTKWDPYWFLEGGVINDVPTKASNVNLANGKAVLRLWDNFGNDELSGAAITTSHRAGRYQVQVGDFVEAKIYFGGSTTEDIYNWPAFWITGKTWPDDGEHDVAEGLGGLLKSVYHYEDANGVHQQRGKATPAGKWGSAYHTYGVHRKATSADIYWDGVLVNSYATSDTGLGEQIVINVGKPRSPDTRAVKTGGASGVRIEYVKAWRP